MKILIFIVTFGLSVGVFADDLRPASPHHSWYCMASGIDPRTNQRVSVSGDNRPTEEQARQSAVANCIGMGWMSCQASTCMSEAGFSR